MVHRAISIDCLFYLLIGVVGYFSQLQCTDPIVLRRPSLPGAGRDYPIIIAVFANMFCVAIATPVIFNPFRQAFFTQVMKRDEFSQKENGLFCFVVLAASCFISIIFPSIKQVISILGGLIAIQFSFVLPTIIWVKLSKKPWTSWENLWRILFFGWLIFMGLGSVVITVYESAAGLDPPKMPRWLPKNDAHIHTELKCPK